MKLEKLQTSILAYNIMDFIKKNPDHKVKDFESSFADKSLTVKYLSHMFNEKLLSKEHYTGRNDGEKNLRHFVKYSLTEKGNLLFNHFLKPSYDEYISYFTEQ